ncbi:NAD(P)H-dependent flavin oxidoreductase [Sphingomonas oryzagri]
MATDIRGLIRTLNLPVIAAPMFLASSLESVAAACRSGVIGSYPALNQRSSASLDGWLTDLAALLADGPVEGVSRLGPHSINLVVHKTNARLREDLNIIIRHEVPVVITSLGADPDVIRAIQAYGGIIFHDVISIKHARKALEAGVDGIIAVCNGAGGHGGTLNPFPFLQELRAITNKPIILAGAVSTGTQVAAAIVAGADLVSIGTRFIAVEEAPVNHRYKEMIVASTAADIVYTPRLSGIHANFLKGSIDAAGVDIAALEAPATIQFGGEDRSDDRVDIGKAKVYVDIWSAGQGVGAITSVPSIADLVRTMRGEFYDALEATTRRYSRNANSGT